MSNECGALALELVSGDKPQRISCSRCSLGDICLPRNLGDDEIGRLETVVQRSGAMHEGDHLFHAGDSFRAVVAVRSGCFKTYLLNKEGDEQVVDFHLPGEIIGLDAIYGGVHLSSSVALDTSAVCTLKFGPLSELARHVPGLQAELFNVMSHRIADLEFTFGDHSADQRLAKFFESLSRRYSRRGYSAREFTLSMSRRDIASYLHLATETVSRILARMKDSGVLGVRRKQIRILDAEQLHAIAEGLEA